MRQRALVLLRSVRVRRASALLCAGLLAVNTACHQYLPLQESVPQGRAGESIGVVLNDRGRLLVGDRLGESVDRVVGQLVSDTGSTITLSVSSTLSLRGSHSVWTGEEVSIPKEGIRGYQERQFSRGRTTALSLGLVLAMVAAAGVITLVAGGLGRGDGGGGGGPGEQ